MKIKKRDKNKDKFFNEIWKGVKDFWKVLKPRDIPTIRKVDDDDITEHWSEDDKFNIEGAKDEENDSDDSQ